MQKLHVACVDPATGQSRPSALVKVLVADTFTLATVYADDETTTLANPIMSDPSGRASFRVADGEYDLEVSGPGFISYKLHNVQAMDKDGYVTRAEFEALVSGITPNLAYVDVKLEFGAHGDGVTNDRAAIQAALDAQKGPLYFRAGTYLIDGFGLTLHSGSKLIGAGTNLTTLKWTTSGQVSIFGDSVVGVAVTDMTLQAAIPGGVSLGSRAISLLNSNQINIARINITGVLDDGIKLEGCSNVTLSDVHNRLSANGIYIKAVSNVINIENYWAEQCTSALRIGTKVTLLTVRNLKAVLTTANVIELEADGTTKPKGMHFINVYCSQSITVGKWLHSTLDLDGLIFENVDLTNTDPEDVPSTSTYWVNDGRIVTSWNGQTKTLGAVRFWARIADDGTVTEGYGIACAHGAAGIYDLTWVAFPTGHAPIVVATLGHSPTFNDSLAIRVASPVVGGCQVRTYAPATALEHDSGFHVMVIGRVN